MGLLSFAKSWDRRTREMGKILGNRVTIRGSGFFVPARVVTNEELSRTLDTTDTWIQERTGIRERRVAAEDENTSDLAFRAAQAALENAGVAPCDVDMIIVATNSPDTLFPGVAPRVQDMLGAMRAGACDVQSGCTGSVYALAMGIAGVSSGLWKNVVVIGAEIISRIVDWSDRKTSVFFGDGSGALVLGEGDEGQGRFVSVDLKSDGSKHDFIVLPAGMTAMPASEETVKKGLHCVFMKGNDVFRFANKVLPDFLRSFLAEADIGPKDIQWWLLHQANMRIIESILSKLDVSPDKAIVNLSRYGNTSAASIFIALAEFLRNQSFAQGDRIVLSAFGAGMTYGAILYEA